MPQQARRPQDATVKHSTSRNDHLEPLVSPSENDSLLGRSRGGAAGQQRQEHVHGGSHVATEESKSLGHLVLLTLVIGGLQTAWTIEMGSITPFLQGIGLSKSLLSLVWIAGPLSGTLVQPWVGIQSDNCRSRFGRRRPFIVGGALATAVSLMALAWTQDIVRGVLGVFGLAPGSREVVVASQLWAVGLIYALDFSINTIQAGTRAFIVDSVPSHQQETANAVAAIVTFLGSIIGFLAGEVKLTAAFSWLGDSQFKILCALSCAALIGTLAISCLAAGERDAWSFGPPSRDGFGVLGFFKTLYRSIRALPRQVKTVCIVEAFAWMGWFPLLFYATTFVGNLYAQPFLEEPGHKSRAEMDEILEEGTRRGMHAMFVFSVVALVFSILLPMIVAPGHKVGRQSAEDTGRGDSEQVGDRPMSKQGAWLAARLRAETLHIPWLSLRRAWMLGHVTFAGLMWLTLLTRTPTWATVLIAAAGFPWVMTQWAPYAFIAAELSKREALGRDARWARSSGPRQALDRGQGEEDEDEDETETQAGIVLGIHNVAVAAPQVVSMLASSVLFRALQKPRGTPGDDSTGWVLRAAGLSALIAAWWTRKVAEGGSE